MAANLGEGQMSRSTMVVMPHMSSLSPSRSAAQRALVNRLIGRHHDRQAEVLLDALGPGPAHGLGCNTIAGQAQKADGQGRYITQGLRAATPGSPPPAEPSRRRRP